MIKENQFTLKESSIIYPIALSALILFSLSDAINHVLLYSLKGNAISISLYVRILYELIFFALITVFINSKRLNFLLTFLILLFGFAIGQFMLTSNYQGKVDMGYHLSLFNKYMFAFVIFNALYKLQFNALSINRLMKVFENIFIFNSLCIIVGAIFGLQVFKSYYEVTYRWGYCGFIPAINEATLFYLIANSYYYYKKFILKIKVSNFRYYLVVISSLLMGAKGIYLFFIALLWFHFIKKSSFQTKLIALFLILFSGICLTIYLNSHDAQDRFEHLISAWKSNGWVSMMLSGRDQHFEHAFYDNLKLWGPLNYLFWRHQSIKIYH